MWLVLAFCFAALTAAGSYIRQDHPLIPGLNRNRELLKAAIVTGKPATNSRSPIGFGSLKCMRWTGGTCRYSRCNKRRGNTTCISGKCMCQPGSCAGSDGRCASNSEGEWIGEYAIRFSQPFDSDRPYLGLSSRDNTRADTSWMIHLDTTADSAKQWKIAWTPNGRVRFEHTAHPGSVLTIYNHFKRHHGELLQSSRQSKPGVLMNTSEMIGKGKNTVGHTHLWPMLVSLERADPIRATFQVRPTQLGGGGLEIWDPYAKVAIANSNVKTDAVGECHGKESGECTGREFVEFEPSLPAKARMSTGRAVVKDISGIHVWQTLLFVPILVVLYCLIARLSEQIHQEGP